MNLRFLCIFNATLSFFFYFFIFAFIVLGRVAFLVTILFSFPFVPHFRRHQFQPFWMRPHAMAKSHGRRNFYSIFHWVYFCQICLSDWLLLLIFLFLALTLSVSISLSVYTHIHKYIHAYVIRHVLTMSRYSINKTNKSTIIMSSITTATL